MTLREKFPMTDAEGQQSAAGPSAALARKPRRKVLFVIGTLDLGGTESQLVLLAKELKQRGWKVEVFALSQGGVLSETLNRAGIRVLYGLHRPNPLPASPTVAKVGAKSGAAPTRRPSVKAMLVLGAAVTSLV
ncbi:MAG: hypothetical protein E5W75_07400, partial [Mesorhizobium sp.]